MKAAVDWPHLQLRRVFRLVNGGTPPHDPDNWGGSVTWITPEDLGAATERVLLSSRRTLTDIGVDSSSATVVPMGAVVLSTRAPIGYVGVAGLPLTTNQGCRSLVPRQPDTDSRYFAYVLESERQNLQAEGRGTTFLELDTDSLASFRVPVPTPHQQRLIADYLDDESARIATAIVAYQRLTTVIWERRSALAAEALSALLRDHQSMPLGRLMAPVDETGRTDLEVLSLYRDRGVIPKSSRDDNFNKTPSDLTRYQVVRVGDVVVNKMKAWQGSIAVSSSEGIISPDYLVCRPNAKTRPDYLHAALRAPQMRARYAALSEGIRPAQWRLQWDKMRTIQLPVPDERVQTAFAASVGHGVGIAEDLVRCADDAIALLRERRLSQISSAVAGCVEFSARTN